MSSYYVATRAYPSDEDVASGDLTCDVCIVGGGYTGLSAALYLAENKCDVMLRAESLACVPDRAGLWIFTRLTCPRPGESLGGGFHTPLRNARTNPPLTSVREHFPRQDLAIPIHHTE